MFIACANFCSNANVMLLCGGLFVYTICQDTYTMHWQNMLWFSRDFFPLLNIYDKFVSR